MIAPSGGFSPPGSSGGSGVSVFMFHRTRVAVCGLKRTASAAAAALASSWRSGVMSSRIQKPRPCVAATRSSSLMMRSRTEVAGMFSRSDCQWSPSSKET